MPKKLLAPAVLIMAALLAGCASNAGAEQGPSSPPSVSASETPATTPTEKPSVKPSPVETQKPSSNLVVDYASFANWDSDSPGVNPIYEHQRAGSHESVCDAFFAANGLTNPEFMNDEQSWKGEQIVAYLQPRLELAWKLNLDTSKKENASVAKNILECLTSGTESDAYQQLSNVFDSYRGSSIEGTSPAANMENITRESGGQWLSNGSNLFVVEYATTDGLGDKLYPKLTFEWSKMNDYRIYSINNMTHGDDSIVWGKQTIVVHDQSRANAPATLE